MALGGRKLVECIFMTTSLTNKEIKVLQAGVPVACAIFAGIALLQTCHNQGQVREANDIAREAATSSLKANDLAQRALEMSTKEAESERNLIWCSDYDSESDVLDLKPCTDGIHAQDILIHWPSELLGDGWVIRRLDPSNAKLHIEVLRNFLGNIDKSPIEITPQSYTDVRTTQPEFLIPIAVEAQYVAKAELLVSVGMYYVRVPITKLVKGNGGLYSFSQEPSVPALISANEILIDSPLQEVIDREWVKQRAQPNDNKQVIYLTKDSWNERAKKQREEAMATGNITLDQDIVYGEGQSELDGVRLVLNGIAFSRLNSKASLVVTGSLENRRSQDLELRFHKPNSDQEPSKSAAEPVSWMSVTDSAGRKLRFADTSLNNRRLQQLDTSGQSITIRPQETVELTVTVEAFADGVPEAFLITWWIPGTESTHTESFKLTFWVTERN